MRFNNQRWLGLALLALIFGALGIFMVPAHWGSLWGDRDFTDWSVPIANRLHDGARLYTEGLHSPMPPLPYVLPRLLFPQGAVWWDGSLLNYGFQTGMILLLFWALAGEVGVGAALIAALAAIPVYLSFQKTMLYDSMAQFLVAATGITATNFVRKINQNTSGSGRWMRLAGLGTLLALLMLTKQNTGIGAGLGVCVLLAVFPASASFSKRCGNIFLTLLVAIIVFCLLALALSRFLSFSGLIHDVFLTASEPKGGPLRMVKSLVIYSLQMGVAATGLYLLIYIGNACVGVRLPSPRELFSRPDDESIPSRKKNGVSVVLAALAGSALGLGLALINAKFGVSLKGTMMDTAWGTLVLNAGLCLVLLLIGSLLVDCANRRNRELSPLVPYAVVFLFSMMFHNLSVARLRWTVDNNPLVFVALALVAAACLQPGRENAEANKFNLTPLIACFLVFIMWPLADYLTLNVVGCTESWPEVHHLAGARLRPESKGMRDLVQTVRSLSDPARGDTVLLLPNDPNVESWFERDRPRLSSAIIFTDQYWDRYVDRDFAALQAQPPKVVVIGPRNYWRFFCRGWNVNRGAERLIDLVREQMLAKDYELKSEQPIAYQGGTDYMDVYVRRGN